MTAARGRGHTVACAHLSRAIIAEHLMAMPVANRRWSAREVRALIAASPLATPRYELVDGELLVTPSPSFQHQAAATHLVVLLHGYLASQGVGEAFVSPTDVELGPEFVGQPDVYVVPTPEARRLRKEGLPVRALLLAVEVLSPSSGSHDRVRKRPMYQRHVPEYWIVDLDARLVERWRPGDERPEVLTQTLEWLPTGASEPLRLDITRFVADVLDD